MSDSERKKANLRIANWDGVFAALNAGCGETYVPPFAIALQATNLQIGLLSSLPNLIAALVQLFAPQGTAFFGSRKKLINMFVGLQSLMWLPVAITPFFFGGHAVTFLILFYAVYLSFGSFSIPAWGSLMADSVPEEERGRYFGNRGKLIGAATVLGGFGAGFALHFFTSNPFVGYAVIFLAAAACRMVSNYFIFLLFDPPHRPSKEHHFTFTQFVRRLPQSNFAKYVFTIGFFHFGAYLAGPYFAILMLRDFQFSYMTYTVLITSAAVSSLLGVAYWGKHADEYGNTKLIKLCAFLLAFIPPLWIVSQAVWYLFIVQWIAGYLWGGFNLCIANFIYDAAIPQKRLYCIAYFNVVNGACIFLGTILGGLLSTRLPLLAGYRIFSLLVISAAVRFAVAWFLLPQIKEVRPVKDISHRALFMRISGLGPAFGVSDPGFMSFRKGKSRP